MVTAIAAIFFSSRARKRVKKRIDYTQENLKNAKELVKIFKQQRAVLKEKKGFRKPK